MLAQNFKTADELGLHPKEHQALIKVLGMLERGDLRYVPPHEECDDGFNMGTSGRGCGTPACIGGWAASLMGIDQIMYMDRYDYQHRFANPQLHELFWNEEAVEGSTTVEQAATALRSYLTTGHAHWAEALA